MPSQAWASPSHRHVVSTRLLLSSVLTTGLCSSSTVRDVSVPVNGLSSSWLRSRKASAQLVPIDL